MHTWVAFVEASDASHVPVVVLRKVVCSFLETQNPETRMYGSSRTSNKFVIDLLSDFGHRLVARRTTERF